MQTHSRTRSIRWTMVLLAAALGLTTLHCALPTDPGMPRWDVPFAVPFSSQRYGLDSLVSKPAEIDSNMSGIIVGGNGELSFWFTDSIPTTRINVEDLAFQPETEDSFVVETDTIFIPAQSERQNGILLGTLLPGGIPSGGYTGPVASFTIPPATEYVTFSGFDSLGQVHIVTPGGGQLEISFRNDTGLPWDDITLVIEKQNVDSSWEALGGPIPYGSVPAHSSDLPATLDLSDEWLTANIRFEVQGSSPGAANTTLTENDQLRFAISISEMKVDIAEAILPRQEVVAESFKLELNQEDWITSAVIDSGYMYFQVLNQTDVADSVIVTFLDFINITGGDTLDFPLLLEANSAFVDSFDLADYELVLPMPTDESDTQGLSARTSVIILGSPPHTYSAVRTGDSVMTKYYTGKLKFSSFSGVPKDISFVVGQQTQELNIFGDQTDLQQDLVGKMLLNDVHVDVHLNNTFDVPALLTLNMTAYNSQAAAPFDQSNQVFQGTLESGISILTIPNLENLINILPDQIDFSVTVQTGRDYFQPSPPYVARTVTANDSVSGFIEIISPFSLVINDTTALRPVPTQMQQPLNAPLRSFTLITYIVNEVPVNGVIYLMAGSFDTEEEARTALVRTNYDQYGVMTPLDIPVPEVNAQGRPVAPASDSLTTFIPEDKLTVFKQENVWVRQVLVLYPTIDLSGNIVPVTMYPDDAILVTVLAQATLAVNEEDTAP
ncbi:MAG: hypothetical protein V2A56_02850 [bacterium]